MDLEKARVILDLIKKREKTKKEEILTTEKIVETALSQFNKSHNKQTPKEVPSKRNHYQTILPPKKQKIESNGTSEYDNYRTKLQHTKTSPKRNKNNGNGATRHRRNSIEVMKIHNLLNTD